jgi:hypothetical protein
MAAKRIYELIEPMTLGCAPVHPGIMRGPLGWRQIGRR